MKEFITKGWLSLVFGLPAIMAWVGYGAAWLLSPHLVANGMEAPDPLMWAAYAAGGYYALWICIGVIAAGGVVMW